MVKNSMDIQQDQFSAEEMQLVKIIDIVQHRQKLKFYGEVMIKMENGEIKMLVLTEKVKI